MPTDASSPDWPRVASALAGLVAASDLDDLATRVGDALAVGCGATSALAGPGGCGVGVTWNEDRTSVTVSFAPTHSVIASRETAWPPYIDDAVRALADGAGSVAAMLKEVVACRERAHAQRQLVDEHAAVTAELASVVQRLLVDRAGFFRSLDEIERLQDELDIRSVDAVFLHDLHTLKAHATLMGFELFEQTCHTIESELLGAREYTDEQRERLRGSWLATRERIEVFAAGSGRGIHVLEREFDELAVAIRSGSEAAAMILDSWMNPTVSTVLEATFYSAQRLASRQGTRLVVQFEGGEQRLRCAAHERALHSLVHIANNAITHGIEPAEERIAAGKPEASTLRVTVLQNHESLRIRVADDGRGIDWARVRARAIECGLPHATAEDLEMALFADEFSTKTAADVRSGRGIGLAAVAAAAGSFRGSCTLSSVPGCGTTVDIWLPHRFESAHAA